MTRKSDTRITAGSLLGTTFTAIWASVAMPMAYPTASYADIIADPQAGTPLGRPGTDSITVVAILVSVIALAIWMAVVIVTSHVPTDDDDADEDDDAYRTRTDEDVDYVSYDQLYDDAEKYDDLVSDDDIILIGRILHEDGTTDEVIIEETGGEATEVADAIADDDGKDAKDDEWGPDDWGDIERRIEEVAASVAYAGEGEIPDYLRDMLWDDPLDVDEEQLAREHATSHADTSENDGADGTGGEPGGTNDEETSEEGNERADTLPDGEPDGEDNGLHDNEPSDMTADRETDTRKDAQETGEDSGKEPADDDDTELVAPNAMMGLEEEAVTGDEEPTDSDKVDDGKQEAEKADKEETVR